MLNTVSSLVAGAMLIASPLSNEQIVPTETSTIEITESAESEVSYTVSVNSTIEELDDIKAAAEEAGMGFTYKKRGVKTRFVIDMVIETEEDYTMERLVIREEDGTKTISWSVNDKGQAVAFIKDVKVNLTQNSR